MKTDLRDAGSNWRQQLRLTLIVVVALSFGIGANTAVAADQIIPRRLLFADEDKLNVR